MSRSLRPLPRVVIHLFRCIFHFVIYFLDFFLSEPIIRRVKWNLQGLIDLPWSNVTNARYFHPKSNFLPQVQIDLEFRWQFSFYVKCNWNVKFLSFFHNQRVREFSHQQTEWKSCWFICKKIYIFKSTNENRRKKSFHFSCLRLGSTPFFVYPDFNSS